MRWIGTRWKNDHIGSGSVDERGGNKRVEILDGIECVSNTYKLHTCVILKISVNCLPKVNTTLGMCKGKWPIELGSTGWTGGWTWEGEEVQRGVT